MRIELRFCVEPTDEVGAFRGIVFVGTNATISFAAASDADRLAAAATEAAHQLRERDGAQPVEPREETPR